MTLRFALIHLLVLVLTVRVHLLVGFPRISFGTSGSLIQQRIDFVDTTWSILLLFLLNAVFLMGALGAFLRYHEQ